MWPFNKGHPRFISDADEDVLEASVKEFERLTGCELVYYFARSLGPEPEKFNEALFRKLRLHEVEHNNAILISVAPDSRQIAIHVGEGVLRKTSDPSWRHLIQKMIDLFKVGKNLEGLLAVRSLEALLAQEQPGHTKISPEDEVRNRPIREGENE